MAFGVVEIGGIDPLDDVTAFSGKLSVAAIAPSNQSIM
jgi:hypothetical protein